MEKDERNGMKPETAGKYIAKIVLGNNVKPICTPGIGYKCLSLLCKLLPCRFIRIFNKKLLQLFT